MLPMTVAAFACFLYLRDSLENERWLSGLAVSLVVVVFFLVVRSRKHIEKEQKSALNISPTNLDQISKLKNVFAAACIGTSMTTYVLVYSIGFVYELFVLSVIFLVGWLTLARLFQDSKIRTNRGM